MEYNVTMMEVWNNDNPDGFFHFIFNDGELPINNMEKAAIIGDVLECSKPYHNVKLKVIGKTTITPYMFNLNVMLIKEAN